MTTYLQIIRMTMNKTRFNCRDAIPVFTLIHVSNILNTRDRSFMTSPISAQNVIPIRSFLANNTCCLRIYTRSSIINITHAAYWFSFAIFIPVDNFRLTLKFKRRNAFPQH